MKYHILKYIKNVNYYSLPSQLTCPICFKYENMHTCKDIQTVIDKSSQNISGEILYAIFLSDVTTEEISQIKNAIKCHEITKNDLPAIYTDAKIQCILKIHDVSHNIKLNISN